MATVMDGCIRMDTGVGLAWVEEVDVPKREKLGWTVVDAEPDLIPTEASAHHERVNVDALNQRRLEAGR